MTLLTEKARLTELMAVEDTERLLALLQEGFTVNFAELLGDMSSEDHLKELTAFIERLFLQCSKPNVESSLTGKQKENFLTLVDAIVKFIREKNSFIIDSFLFTHFVDILNQKASGSRSSPLALEVLDYLFKYDFEQCLNNYEASRARMDLVQTSAFMSYLFTSYCLNGGGLAKEVRDQFLISLVNTCQTMQAAIALNFPDGRDFSVYTFFNQIFYGLQLTYLHYRICPLSYAILTRPRLGEPEIVSDLLKSILGLANQAREGGAVLNFAHLCCFLGVPFFDPPVDSAHWARTFSEGEADAHKQPGALNVPRLILRSPYSVTWYGLEFDESPLVLAMRYCPTFYQTILQEITAAFPSKHEEFDRLCQSFLAFINQGMILPFPQGHRYPWNRAFFRVIGLSQESIEILNAAEALEEVLPKPDDTSTPPHLSTMVLRNVVLNETLLLWWKAPNLKQYREKEPAIPLKNQATL